MSKYGNKKIEIDGYTFDSLAEGRRYEELKLFVLAGEIFRLKVHPKFVLQRKFSHQKKKIRSITYTADFSYRENGRLVVEDIKGKATQVFQLKKKLFLFKFPEIDFRIVKA